MKFVFTFCILSLLILAVKAQKAITVKDPKADTTIYEIGNVGSFPQIPGGSEWFSQYIRDSCRYPISAIEEGIQGRVIISFIVEKDGTIDDAKVVKGVSSELDKEALRLINNMPKWKAGVKDEKNVRVELNVPITFGLNPK